MTAPNLLMRAGDRAHVDELAARIRDGLTEARLSISPLCLFIPPTGLKVDLPEPGSFAGQQKLLLESRQKKLLELVQMGGAVDQNDEGSAGERFERTVVGQGGWDEFFPGCRDLR